MTYWICGRWTNNVMWEFQGLFDTEQKAIDACKSDRYFIAPAVVNEELTEVSESWPGCYFPKG